MTNTPVTTQRRLAEAQMAATVTDHVGSRWHWDEFPVCPPRACIFPATLKRN